ncbi:hypothetical protein CRG98_025263 [Punica granatum]|uniref:Uncharacterized protein n=1 Tax=Punica granatum TaxID=22663 RepID=A0A2I0JDM6_PUNGR|nr:hypothetical protein CRG98_025263 [Punica granatum]
MRAPTRVHIRVRTVGMNHTTHLDPPSSALRVSDALFMSLEAQSRQTEITVISGSAKQLRKQSEKSSFGLLGHLRLHIGITDVRVKCPCEQCASRALSRNLRARAFSHALVHSSCTSRAPIFADRASFAPEHPSKRSTESPDSRTLLRLFPRIPRQACWKMVWIIVRKTIPTQKW